MCQETVANTVQHLIPGTQKYHGRQTKATTGRAQSLAKIGFDLLIKNNNGIETLAGLEGLAVVQGEIMLHNNYALTTTKHMAALTTVKVGIDIYGNANLEDMHGFRFVQGVMVRPFLPTCCLHICTDLSDLLIYRSVDLTGCSCLSGGGGRVYQIY